MKNLLAKKEEKFIVIKTSDLDNYFSQFQSGLLATPTEKDAMNKVPFMQVLKELDNKNKYIVCNQDEPYADLVWQIILMGENTKQLKKLEKEKNQIYNENKKEIEGGKQISKRIEEKMQTTV